MKLFFHKKIVLIYLSQKRSETDRREKFYFNNCKQLYNNDGLPTVKPAAGLVRKPTKQLAMV
jgi:hypothetical protein